MGRETAPVLVASVIAIIIFVVGSSFRQVAVNSKPWESLCGCIIPLVALLTSTGLISAFGLKFQSICVASLFLVTSVGVDDVFIILRAWDRTQQSLPAHERLSKTLKDAGPSITVSSLTNALSFAIGILSMTPAVRTFSIYSCLSIIICYFYQLILFTAILVLSDRREKRGYQSLLCCLKANPQARNNFLVTLSDLQLRVVKYWSNVISTWSARFVLSLFMLAYYYYSIVGASRLHAHIALERMFLPDSYLADFHQTLDVALKEMQPLNVFVMNPGDLRNVTRMEEMKAMVKEYENAKFMYGSDSTFFWLPLYEEFLEFYSDTENFTYVEIPAFFGLSPYEMMKSLVKMNESACILDQPECISSFFFVTNFRDVVKYHEMIPAVAEWRRIAAKYSDLGVVPYSHHVPFVDQTLTIESTVIWSVAAALTCTAAVCFIFIPNTISILCAVYSVFSISIGIFGLLSHWGIDLDPLSMAALLIAIGCSVDFTAHISYHYYRAKAEDPRERLEKSLAVIGWPMLQVGISTTIALLPLLLKQSYLALVFLKTVIVVVGLGVFHGLVVLPAILTATGKLIGSSENSAVSSERSSQRSNERVESFYKNQRLIKKINHEIGHLGIPEMKPNRIFWGKKRGDKVEPGDATNLPTGPIAFIHRFELGRVALTPPLPRKTTDSTLSQVEKMEDILRSPPSK
ncbi:hypothetical protein AB6A40_004389 [Gnathostoma spinigerum]|uniref:SSD domain-containing protein n=1 Tax=Gnathostoma spinigerum TaxID=75299 RepID=A0ABD6EDG4_9BILA